MNDLLTQFICLVESGQMFTFETEDSKSKSIQLLKRFVALLL
jgi:hypothetical protein